MSGECLSVAMATGLNPLFDRYEEIENPYEFYLDQLYLDKFWKCWTSNLKDVDRRRFFLSPESLSSSFNPFDNRINFNTAGWFYPWGINLCDEEVEIIYNSKGIIGLNLDERILGKGMLNYKMRGENYLDSFLLVRQRLMANLTDSELSFSDYLSCEPLLRNILYIVDVSKKDGISAWSHVALGTDFDGLIDPIDICPSADSIPIFHKKMELALPIFWELNKCRYSRDLFFGNSISFETAMSKFFFENGRDFILNNF